ncbi:hypothetical protein [Streptomyces sp. NPDC056255]|uniref:hypothetical protein n=1 Tax=Streptomyces sp. NPDC056255 TaxID=3345764 RepID=UPI0035DEBE1A
MSNGTPQTAPPKERTPKEWPVRLGYIAVGLGIGGAWLLGRDVPPWEHALRLLAIVVVVPPAVHLLRRRRARATLPHLPLRHLVAAKVLLVGAALGLDALLALWTVWAPVATALTLTLIVAVGGPPLHQRLQPRPTANPQSEAA